MSKLQPSTIPALLVATFAIPPMLACGLPSFGPPAEGTWVDDQIDPVVRAEAQEVVQTFWRHLAEGDLEAARQTFAWPENVEIKQMEFFHEYVGDAQHTGDYLSETYLVREPDGEPLLVTGRTRSHQIVHENEVQSREVYIALKPFTYRTGERLARTQVVRMDDGEWRVKSVRFGPSSYGGLEPPDHYEQAKKALDEERWLDAFFHTLTGRCIERTTFFSYVNTFDSYHLQEVAKDHLTKQTIFSLDEIPTKPVPIRVAVEPGADHCETHLSYQTVLRPEQTEELADEAQQVVGALSARLPGFAAAPAQVVLLPVSQGDGEDDSYTPIEIKR